MFPFYDIFLSILLGVVVLWLQPMFWLMVMLVASQYYRMQQNQLYMFGVIGRPWWRQTLLAAAYGTVGGLIGSLILIFVGVTINQLGFNYIWPLAIGLMLIHIRFLCFAYAGGLVALSNVLFGWPEVNVPQVLALVAILHITESILIAISTRYSAVPVILRHEGRIVGAFTLQNFWPLPIILAYAYAVPVPDIMAMTGVIATPDWWPLLPVGEQLPPDTAWFHKLAPVVAALGYSDMAVSSMPGIRRRRSALHLFFYSATLLAVSLLSVRYSWLQLVAALLSPLGHEALIRLDNRQELQGRPRFVQQGGGLTVLDTVEGSVARRMGLQPGDILLRFGEIPLQGPYDLENAIAWSTLDFTLEWRRGEALLRQRARFAGERRLGIILAPFGHEENYIEVVQGSFGLFHWLKRLFRR
ncbi:hypothetical protein [Acetonema longum]|uniref:PDZ/DHR/GLGF domain protein n=1 Tax=Acetonema longum DSM 6540 TaxID=1009370 RepID=F7NNZ2_9FIRM|nr:hypothetical protein [Acetonema longum]EGO62326.1 PDZ/DHR/GLGF domain protein [Acetonema longum DSM 6540]